MVIAKGGGLIPQAKKNNFKTFEIFYKKIFWPISFFKLLIIIVKNKIDIINTHSSEDAWLLGILGKILKIPVIRTRHLSTRVKKGLNSIFLYNFLADHIVTTSSEIIDKISKSSKKKKDNFSFIPTGIDVLKILKNIQKTKEFRKKYKILDDDLLVGTVCFMRSWKGVFDFIKAAKILKKHQKIKWIVIGGGHMEKYMKLAKDEKLQNVIFTGHLENPYHAIDALDIFLLLSTAHEGVSQASLQAALFEKPLITTKTGGLKDVCIHNETGINVDVFSPNQVAESVLFLQKNKHIAKNLAKKARKRVLENFTQEKMISQILEIYDKF